MEDITTPREKILKKVRSGLLNKFPTHFGDVELETELYKFSESDHAVAFAKHFTAMGGGFVYCHNAFDFHENLIIWMEKRGIKFLLVSDPDLKREMQNLGLPLAESPQEHPGQTAALLASEALMARNGGIVFSSSTTQRDLLNCVETVAVMGNLSRMADDMKHILVLLKNRYGEKLPSLISFIQGPSSGQNAGVRKELILFLINDKA
ncbi:MAG: hypothetical protein GC180_10705 [Bacteroidetes bacterium]|nr:hypothetical protein [Bacteroidota bacterium]